MAAFPPRGLPGAPRVSSAACGWSDSCPVTIREAPAAVRLGLARREDKSGRAPRLAPRVSFPRNPRPDGAGSRSREGTERAARGLPRERRWAVAPRPRGCAGRTETPDGNGAGSQPLAVSAVRGGRGGRPQAGCPRRRVQSRAAGQSPGQGVIL